MQKSIQPGGTAVLARNAMEPSSYVVRIVTEAPAGLQREEGMIRGVVAYAVGWFADIIGDGSRGFAILKSLLVLGTVTGGIWDGFAGLLAAHVNFWTLPSVQWIVLFWLADWTTGTILAVLRRSWRPRRSLYSVFKLLGWIGALWVGWGLTQSGITGSALAAAGITATVVFTEGASVLKNLALLASYGGHGDVALILRKFASWISARAEENAPPPRLVPPPAPTTPKEDPAP